MRISDWSSDVCSADLMRPDACVFRSQGKSVSVRLEGRLNISVNEVATSAAVAGLGIASTAIWGCREELERGELARVLTDWELGTVDLPAVLPAGHPSQPASQAFLHSARHSAGWGTSVHARLSHGCSS